MIFRESRHLSSKIRKEVKKLSSAAVVIGALRGNLFHLNGVLLAGR